MIHIEQCTLVWTANRAALEFWADKNKIPHDQIHLGCFKPPDGDLYSFIILRKEKK